MPKCVSLRDPRSWRYLALAASFAALSGCDSSHSSNLGLPVTLTRLSADQAGANHLDTDLANAWGVGALPTGPIWVSDNATGKSTVYAADGTKQGLVVSLPGVGGAAHASPTGLVADGAASFMGDKFIFAGEEGSIQGWSAGTTATIRVNENAAGRVFKGIARAQAAGGPRLYVADFHGGRIEVFDTAYAPVATAGPFTEPGLPAGYAPFNILASGSSLFVAYALQDVDKHDDSAGAGHGYISVFNPEGQFQRRLVSAGLLNSPWGMAIAPNDWGVLANDLLVGNFGDGRISAYNPTTGASLGQLTTAGGAPLVIDGLWGLAFGNDALSGSHADLLVTAGPGGEAHGLLAVIRPSF